MSWQDPISPGAWTLMRAHADWLRRRKISEKVATPKTPAVAPKAKARGRKGDS